MSHQGYGGRKFFRLEGHSREIAERIAGHPAGAAMTIKQGLISQRGIDDPEAFFAESTNTALLTAGMVKG